MSDTIGRIIVPDLVDSGLTFPLTSDFGFGYPQDWPIVVHRFGTNDAKSEQRYQTGIGPKRHAFKRASLSQSNRNNLVSFWEGLQGPWKTFLYKVPNPDQTVTLTRVIWESAPLSINYLVNACQVGFNFVEVPDPTAAPGYPVSSTCVGFPSATLAASLQSDVQQIIPLVHIKVREAGVPEVYLSDRRCTVGSQLYLPRLLEVGERGSGDLITQELKGASDSLMLTFGNADRMMTRLANDTDLRDAAVDFSLYHVQSGILLQLWAGSVLDYARDGSPQFSIQAGDPLSRVTQQYPPRIVSRSCWKTFNDGVNCPYDAEGSGGDPTSCDYYFDSANGCVSHGMTPRFGGIPASPQGVNIKDNSTGTWGLGRNRVTATSIISESVWGNALAETWCDSGGDPAKALWLTAMIVAVRDESDFSDALGIIGAGPIGQFTAMQVVTNADGFKYVVAPLLDGQTPHGFAVDENENITRNEPNFGLVQISGTDPQSAVFGLNAGGVAQGNGTAAGTAWCEIRRTDTKGIQPSTPESHSMTVPIDKGLSGYVWDAGGTRSLVSGLTNPFWIAINSYLRAIGLFNADSATQLAKFSLPAAFAGDGTGAAEIADTIVDVLIGTGTEKQFTFQGTLAQKKPFRDWLNEILMCGLGYFTWEFGKLAVGCRDNASAVDAYGPGNILFQSLRLPPIKPTFEHMIIEFANQAYQYQADTAEYVDKDHAAYFDRAGVPLESRIHSVGTSTLSQGSRLAATRTREEIGGVNAVEWRNACTPTWGTTLLGLSSRPGQVVSITHPDIPGIRGVVNVSGATATWVSGDALDASMVGKVVLISGVECIVQSVSGADSFTVDVEPGDGEGLSFAIITGEFRVQSRRLKKDYSIEMTAKTVTASMYDLTVGPKPLDVTPGTLPPLRYPLPLALVWNPFQVQADSADPLYPSEYSFDVAAAYSTLADASASAVATVAGKLPINDYSTDIYGAPVIGSLTVNASGGAIAGDVTLRISLCAVDSDGKLSNASAIAIVPLGAGSAFEVVLDNITWPGNAAGITSWVLFAATKDDLICSQLTDTGTPTTITFDGPVVRSTWGIPSAYVAKVRVKGKRELAAGVTYGKVTAVSGSTLTVTDPATGVSFVSGSYTGRVLSVIGRESGNIPFLHFTIAGLSGDTFTLDRATTGVSVDDIVVVRFGGGSTGTALTGAGFTADALVGNTVRVIAGTGRGSLGKITANTTTGITLAASLTLDSTSVWIVEEAAWTWSADGANFDNALNSTQAQWALQMSNLSSQAVLLSGFTVDRFGGETPDGDQPVREVWLAGYSPTQIVTPAGTQDGSNADFTLPSTPTNPDSVKLFKNGLLLDLTLDYTITGDTITYVVAPQSDDWLEATYF